MRHKSPITNLMVSVLCSAGCWLLGTPVSTLAATANVNIEDFDFNPPTSSINVNDSVKWTWTGSAPHTTTSTTSLWNSPQQSSGTFTRMFTTAGTFPYFCTVHSFMTASVTVHAAAVPPTVTITNPANGAILNAPASFVLGATASQTGGTVTNVQLLQSTTSLTNRTTIPYSVAISNLAAGSYTFSAVATGNAGLKATNSISLTVNALPTATISAPTNGATFAAPWTGVIHANVGDTDGSVTNARFFAGTTLLGTMPNPPASPSLNVTNLAAGNYVLTTVATDNRGASATSAVVNLSVVTPIPIVLSSVQRVSASAFQFSYSANSGLRYLVHRAQGMTNFTPIATNTATSNTVNFLDSTATGTLNLYRVQLLPNP